MIKFKWDSSESDPIGYKNDECRSEIEARINNVKTSIRRLKVGTFFQ